MLPSTLLSKRTHTHRTRPAPRSHPNIVQTYAHFSDVVVVERQPQHQQHGAPPPAPPPGAAPAAPQLRLCAHDDPVFRGRKAGPLNTVLCLVGGPVVVTWRCDVVMWWWW